MYQVFSILFLILISGQLSAQSETFTAENYAFEIETEVIPNDWETEDTLQTVYRMGNGERVEVLKFYRYKDEGGDCNNLFWDIESLEVEGDRLILNSHYLQKTGIDPIPEWRKRVYTINQKGELILKFDKYKYYNSSEWVDG